MSYIIGDTIRFLATIKNFEGAEEKPAVITVSVYKLDGTVMLAPITPDLIDGTPAQYKYDWLIPIEIKKNSTLVTIWDWSGPQKKEISFSITSLLD